MRKKVIRLTESDIENLVKKIIKEDSNLNLSDLAHERLNIIYEDVKELKWSDDYNEGMTYIESDLIYIYSVFDDILSAISDEESLPKEVGELKDRIIDDIRKLENELSQLDVIRNDVSDNIRYLYEILTNREELD